MPRIARSPSGTEPLCTASPVLSVRDGTPFFLPYQTGLFRHEQRNTTTGPVTIRPKTADKVPVAKPHSDHHTLSRATCIPLAAVHQFGHYEGRMNHFTFIITPSMVP